MPAEPPTEMILAQNANSGQNGTAKLLQTTNDSRPSGQMTATEEIEDSPKYLNIFYRFVLYGLVGLAVEICFTATWEIFQNGNRKLHGITSIYAFFIYGMSSIVVERMYFRLQHLAWYVRGLIYLAWTYALEFSTGFFLRRFDACPWDYEPYFKGHIMGLITMEYAPLWYVGSMFEEQFIIQYVLHLQWQPKKLKKKQS